VYLAHNRSDKLRLGHYEGELTDSILLLRTGRFGIQYYKFHHSLLFSAILSTIYRKTLFTMVK